MSEDEHESPRSYRVPGLKKGFLPLNSDDSALSTRGQALPGIISARKNSTADKLSFNRRPSSLSDDVTRTSTEGHKRNSSSMDNYDIEAGVWRRGSSFTPMWGGSDSEPMDDNRRSLLMTSQRAQLLRASVPRAVP